MSDYAIPYADLKGIENNLKTIYNNLDSIENKVSGVGKEVSTVYKELGDLAKEFHDYVARKDKADRLQLAHTKVVKIRQELDNKYGHYDIVRRSTTGILQADDLGIVKKDTISNATEDLMISTPNYWLAPCLVALAAWINDQPELADKALREAIKRNDEKTSLFFALVCRRAGRKQASLKWTQRYLANQDEENLDRKAIIVLDAFASGLMGADTEGLISKQIDEWMDKLAETPGFVEKQTTQWSKAISAKRKPLNGSGYQYLSKYSHTWSALKDVMEGAQLHADILQYFTDIFEQKVTTKTLKEQLDEILDSLVTDFDDEELPLRKKEKYEQLVIDFDGDERRAKQNMAIEETAFETHKDFTQLLTDAAMNPELAHSSVSTQKFAIALSKDWIMDAYNDVTAKNRMKVPHIIEINVDNFNSSSTDGQNEEEVLANFYTMVESEKNSALAQCQLSGFDKFCLPGGAVIGGLGLIMVLTGNIFLGLIAIVGGIAFLSNHFSKKKSVTNGQNNIQFQFGEKRKSGEQIIRAIMAEIVDYRAEFARADRESQKVIDFLEQITPEQYVAKLSNSSRKINVNRGIK